MHMRLLVADSAEVLTEELASGLVAAGHVVDTATTGADALWHATEGHFDVMVLEVGLDDPGGIEICRRVRARRIWTPILLVSAQATVEEGVGGLDAGADDYLSKPFELEELEARLRALHRRGAHPRPTVLRSGGLEIDPARRIASREGRQLRLTAREFELLALLVQNQGIVVSRKQILAKLWDFAFEPSSNVVEVTVRRLRTKVDRPFESRSIETVRGVGYRFVDGATRQPDARPG